MTAAKVSTRQVAVAGLLGALTICLGLMPALGFIPVPTPAGHATTMHIPTIIAALVEGPIVGGAVGVIFGAFSFYRAQTEANPVARLMFTDPLIAFFPRVAIGVVTWLVFWLCVRLGKEGTRATGGPLFALGVALVVAHTAYQAVLKYDFSRGPGAMGLAGVAGVLVGLGTWRILSHAAGAVGLAALAGSLTNTVGVLGLSVLRGYLPGPAALAVGLLHGVPEMLVAAVLAVLVYRGLSASPRRSAVPSGGK